ncbi:hypothetical protein K9M74_00770 [Candidatus Woesearchaeota archaeon]|nr:hypothetical protein [Candidatus Woesearchaeota archaeon]
MLERLLTDIRADIQKDRAVLYFRDTGQVHAPLDKHIFVSRDLQPETFKRVQQVLATNPCFADVKVNTFPRSKNKNPFNIIQVTGPPSLGKQLREEFGKTIFSTKNYTQTARARFGNESTIVTMPKSIAETITLAKTHNQQVRLLEQKIRMQLPDKKKGQQTRIINSLHQASQEQNVLDKNSQEYKLTKHLSTDILQDFEKIQQLRTTLAQQEHISLQRQKNQTLEVILNDATQLKPKQQLDYNNCLNQSWAYLDIEIPLFRKEKPEISWVEIHYETDGQTYKEELHTLSNLGVDIFKGNDIIKYNSEADLVLGVRDALRTQHTYFLVAYNGRFDFIKLREAEELNNHDENFTPDEEGYSEPVHEASTRFFERIGIKSRAIIDLLRFAQVQYHFLPNKKLDLVAKVMLGQDAFSKSITYDEMEELEQIAQRYKKIKNKKNIEHALALTGKTIKDTLEESQAAARKIASYVIDDVQIMPQIKRSHAFDNYLKRVTFFANEFKIPFEHLAYSERALLKVNERFFLQRTKTEKDMVFFSQKDARKKYADAKQYFRTILNEKRNFIAEPGLYNNVHLAFLRYGHALQNIITRTIPEANIVFSEKARSKEDSYLLSRYGNVFADWMIADYAEIYKLCKVSLREEEKIEKKYPSFGTWYNQQFWKLWNKSSTIKEKIKKGYIEPKDVIKELHPEIALVAKQESQTTTPQGQMSLFPDQEQPKPLDETNIVQTIAQMINTKQKLNRRKYRFKQEYKATYEEVNGAIGATISMAQDAAKRFGMEIIHQEGPYFYMYGDKTSFEETYPYPVIKTFDNVLITHNATKTKQNMQRSNQRIYYNIFGTFKNMKVVNHPTHYLNVFEMEQFKTFYNHITAKEYKEAIKSIITSYEQLKKQTVPTEKLVLFSKSSERYSALEQGERIYFTTTLPKKTTRDCVGVPIQYYNETEKKFVDLAFDKKYGRPYTLELISQKEKPIYIMQFSDLKPDWNLYLQKNQGRLRNLLYSLVGDAIEGVFEENHKTSSIDSMVKQLQKRVF